MVVWLEWKNSELSRIRKDPREKYRNQILRYVEYLQRGMQKEEPLLDSRQYYDLNGAS